MRMQNLFWLTFNTVISMIGYTIHGSMFWAVIDWIFSPIALVKWILCHEITLRVIQQTFVWFF